MESYKLNGQEWPALLCDSLENESSLKPFSLFCSSCTNTSHHVSDLQDDEPCWKLLWTFSRTWFQAFTPTLCFSKFIHTLSFTLVTGKCFLFSEDVLFINPYTPHFKIKVSLLSPILICSRFGSYIPEESYAGRWLIERSLLSLHGLHPTTTKKK